MHRPTPTAVVLWTLILIGLAAMEFPGVLFFDDRAEPRLFGMPFIYGYITVWWVYMCAVMLVAYRLNWGRRPVRTEGTR